jgi:hypothetical protein
MGSCERLRSADSLTDISDDTDGWLEKGAVLGWHQAQLEYQSLQLALAWVEAEARNSNP